MRPDNDPRCWKGDPNRSPFLFSAFPWRAHPEAPALGAQTVLVHPAGVRPDCRESVRPAALRVLPATLPANKPGSRLDEFDSRPRRCSITLFRCTYPVGTLLSPQEV